MALVIRCLHRIFWMWIILLVTACGSSAVITVAPEAGPSMELISSQDELASLTVSAVPTPDIILVAGEILDSDQSISLEPGTHYLVVELMNHHTHIEQLTLGPGENLEHEVTLRAKEAELTINADPRDMRITIGGDPINVGEPILLQPGSHAIQLSREGYFSEQVTVDLEPGEQKSVSVNLQAVPTSGLLTLSAHHPEARIFLDGVDIGVGSITLELDFGTYNFESIKALADWRREYAGRKIKFDYVENTYTQEFDADGVSLQYKYLGEWLPASELLAIEQEIFDAVTIADPFHIHAELSDAAATALREYSELPEWLFRLLRPGDQLTLSSSGTDVLLWARGNKPDYAFLEGVNAFYDGIGSTPPWITPETDAESIVISITEVADLPFAVFAARPVQPMLSIDAWALEALSDNSIVIHRVIEDGDLKLLVQGGQGLSLDDVSLATSEFDLVSDWIPAGAGAHQLSWASTPERVLLVPRDGMQLSEKPTATLKRGEKQVVGIELGARPEQVHQLTRRLNSEDAAVWETLEWTIAPGEAPDLRDVDLGPHSREGVYHRSWIFKYRVGENLTQRQIDMVYHIGEEQAEVQSGLFLRRRSGSTNEAR